MSLILTPGDPEFDFVMGNMPPPPNWRTHDPHGDTGLIQDLETGVWNPVNQQEFLEVLYEQGDLYLSDEEG
ncbi:hypothetical protein FEK30_13270 [Picosynechococcus sp. PCC 11901]|uniref:hypothetical protein n=1 Tax=Picosynechococcus sp. PCC 11901 TaxID=2579791 RepID=UPI0010FBCAA6|nr:hypothetical protein [Picosynechococcus sp. PCC 11901]QCS50313.1 hypothetical protein FEK30_13270 [Picosynechococcus sp. PCC 11901]